MSLTPLLKTDEAVRWTQPAADPNAPIEMMEGMLIHHAQVECPLTHHFAPGVYFREIFMPAGAFIIGHEHKTEHFNVVLSGKARVLIEGEWHDIAAPCVFVSKPGVRKVLEILEDMRWATIHATEETDMERLEELCIVKSATWLKHFDPMKLTNQEETV